MTSPQTAETRHCRRCELDLPAISFHRGNGKAQPTICKICTNDICNGDVFTMSAAEAATFMTRLEAGEALRTIIGGFGRKPICSRKAFFRHCELHPDWGARAKSLAEQNWKSRILAGSRKRMIARTTCNNGHPLSAEAATRMRIERTWNHMWCEPCVKQWRGVGRFIAEEATEDPPEVDGVLLLSPGPNLTQEDVAEIEKWLRLGVSMRKLLDCRDGGRLRRYRAANPEWEATFQPIIIANAKRAVSIASRKMWKAANLTHCNKGHEFTPDNVYLRTSNGSRQCRTCQLAKTGAPVSEAQIRDAERALLSGWKISDITRPRDGKRSIMSTLQLRTLRATRPDANERIMRSVRHPGSFRSLQSSTGVAPVRGIVLTPEAAITPVTNIPFYEPKPGDFAWLISLTPRYLPQHAREEIASDLWLELASHTLHPDDAPSRAKELCRKHNRDFPTIALGRIDAPLSLDAPAYLDGTMLRGETVSESLWDRM